MAFANFLVRWDHWSRANVLHGNGIDNMIATQVLDRIVREASPETRRVVHECCLDIKRIREAVRVSSRGTVGLRHMTAPSEVLKTLPRYPDIEKIAILDNPDTGFVLHCQARGMAHGPYVMWTPTALEYACFVAGRRQGPDVRVSLLDRSVTIREYRVGHPHGLCVDLFGDSWATTVYAYGQLKNGAEYVDAARFV